MTFHPSRPLVAAAVVTGAVDMLSFSGGAPGAVQTRPAHEECCRAVRFHKGGELLVSAGTDRVLAWHHVEKGSKAVATVAAAHDAAINRLEVVSDTVLASGACALPCWSGQSMLATAIHMST